MSFVLPIEQILKGHTQSLFQALRRLEQSAGYQRQADQSSDDQSATTDCHHLPQEQAAPVLSQAQLLILTQQTGYSPNSASSLLLQDILDSHSSKISGELRTNQRFVDSFLSRLLLQCRPHPEIAELSQRVTLILMVRLLPRPDILINANHPLCKLIQQLYQQIAIWEPAGGKVGKRFCHWLASLAEQLDTLDINSSATLTECNNELQELITQDTNRRQVIEERLLEANRTDDHLLAARQTVITYLNRRLAGQWLPAETCAFIRQHLLSDLQFMLIHQGVECPIWKKWQRLLQVLSWAYSGEHPQKVSTLLPSLIEQFAPIVEQQDNDYWQYFPAEIDLDSRYRYFFTQLQHDFLSVLTQHPPACDRFPQLDAPEEDAHDQVQAVVDQSLIDDLSQYENGDWFFVQQLLNNTDGAMYWAKGKLTDKNACQNRILLTRYNGQKMASKSFDEFALGLATKIIRPFNQRTFYGSVLLATWRQLDKLFQQLQDRNQQAEAEAHARTRAAHKAMQEAHALQEKQALPQNVSLSTMQSETKIEQRDYEELLRQLENLHVGAWLQMEQASAPAIKMKLSVKLLASDKYIFTDHLGQRLMDYTRAELAHLLATQQLSILSQGNNFENSLEKIVRGLRKPST